MFRFTIRDLLWATVMVAIMVAWWVEHREFSDHDREVMRSWRRQSQRMSNGKYGNNRINFAVPPTTASPPTPK